MKWYPANGGHAIERVAFTAMLDFPLAPKGFARLLAEVDQKAAETGINEMVLLPPPPLQIQLSAQDPLTGLPVPQPQIDLSSAGRVYRKTEQGRVLEEIVCNETLLIFAATKYNRWSKFLDRVRQCLSGVLNDVARDTNVREIRVEYWDRFDLRENDEGGSENLISPSSSLLAPYYATLSDSWHSHAGFFSPDGPDRRSLINANVDVVRNSPGLPRFFAPGLDAQARIYTLASAQHITPNQGFEDWEAIKEATSSRHRLLKSLLADVIHPKLSEQINLKAEPLKK